MAGSTKTKKNDAGANGAGRRRLVIVESPAKARKIASYLGPGYVVESSVGHIRDLPSRADDVPAKYKGESWAKLGVNVDHDFEPLYVVSSDKKSKVTELKGLLKDVDELFLATDPDREGEAIAWHLLETLKPKVPVRRMVFHEVTEQAVRAAAEDTRELDGDLVDAQETRRILDRLYGYEVSPVLWKKVMPRLSAGRVQSVATRLVVERERERIKFTSASYWDISATMDAGEDAAPRQFPARLVSVDGARLATGKDFDASGQLKGNAREGVRVLDEAGARALAAGLHQRDFKVTSVEEKPYTRRPYAPFMTSTLQQEAGRKLRFNSETTMQIAQRLYQNGYITYMRTDSTTLSESALAAARSQATELYGSDHVSPSPRQYNRKVKNAQEAHEAIRPAGEVFRTPGQVAGELAADEFRLYEMIWQRTIASQMADAKGTTMSVRITGTATSGEECTFAASGRTITFAGFLKAYVEAVDADSGAEADDKQSRLPRLVEDQPLTASELSPDGHATTPPARYNEPSLVSKLEELGIGRPSTYASIIKTIQDRGYVWKKGAALVPSWVAFAVVGLLERHFERLVDYDFTAAMEDELDRIAAGNEQRTRWLSRFYFGGEQGVDGSIGRLGGLKKLVEGGVEDIDPREISRMPMFDDNDGRTVYVRVGRYGPYIEREVDEKPQRANLPEDLAPDELTAEIAEELFATPQEGRSLGVDPVSGHEIVAKAGRYGPYVTEVLPEPEEAGTGKKTSKAKKPKPRTGSLFQSMDLQTVTLDDALKLLSLPRVVGKDPSSGDEITAQNGRYGPYLKKGTDSRSLTSEDQIFSITLDEALKIYSEPKQRGRRGVAKPPLKELGEDPISKKPMIVKDGRFGPYVTDGEYNATLRKGDSIEGLTSERASELLAEKRAKGPAPKKKAPARRAPAKKAAAKK
ncbi:type I DNA topoisomerase [Amycolatopsis endophytica]|uniref:DNA topoisomerase 1 n=1 Tax=Amycolatopsis endophytica TaxID=860233 RepID=A0A853B2F8_9PSEU|nr:type I DNA topoisomerase [Amycolatopsis endophytica]NYI89004.1 DNA topoisomerase-1 [Amycolatopsis endophytica]